MLRFMGTKNNGDTVRPKTPRRDWGAVAILSTVGLFALVLVVWMISSVINAPVREATQRAEECSSDYGYILQNESYGFRAQDSHLWDGFIVACPEQFDDLNQFLAARESVRAANNDCTQLGELDAGLIEMMESYGECDGVPLAEGYEDSRPAENIPSKEPAPVQVPEEPLWPGGEAIAWDQASQHVGTFQRVCGPLVSSRGDDHGTYLNIGRDYPDARRFTVIFWDVNDIDPIRSGATICTVGEIVDYEGVAQIHTNPEAVEIWE